MRRALAASLYLVACHRAATPLVPVPGPCEDGRIGKVTIEGGSAADVPQLAVLEGTLDDAARTERITKVNKLLSYERAKRLGLNYDLRRDVYAQTQNMSFADLQKFQQAKIKGQSQVILVIGSKDRLNFKELAKYGPVQQVSLKEIFGY